MLSDLQRHATCLGYVEAPTVSAENSAVRMLFAPQAMYKSGRLPVLSFSEGLQTRLGYMKASIVPHESAFPG